jgi:glycosyltransferase involved in cell wall biosynthesis
MPVRDMAAFVGEAVASVRCQDLTAWEMVVVDDGSTDGSGDVAHRCHDARIRVVRQPARGVSAARNRGWRESRADKVVFLDADDRLRPDALGRVTRALDDAPAAAVAYGEVVAMDAAGRVFGTGKPPLFARRPSGPVLRRLLQSNFIATPGAACIRARHLREAGPFREDLARTQDWEMWCRLATVGPFVYLGGPPLLEYRSHPASVSATLGRDIDQTWAGVDAVFGHPEIRARFTPRALRRLRRRLGAGAHALAGTQCLKAGAFTEARRLLGRSLLLHPLRPREAILLAAAWLRWLPGPLRRRLK